MNNGPIRNCGSLYTVSENAIGEERIYGMFKNQRILGYPCDIECWHVEDNDSGVLDILGYDCVQRGDSAIHVSGLDPYGSKTGPGFIRAIGKQKIHWCYEQHQKDPPTGLGCREPEVCIIVSWDADTSGRGHRDDLIWQHHVFWSAAKTFLTLRGVHTWWRENTFQAFTVHDLAERIDQKRPYYLRTAGKQQHERAFRRLLEGHIGVSNNKLPRERGQVMLKRAGRGKYTFTEGEMA